MAYGVFESTNMASTKKAARIFDCVASTDIENGTCGYLNGLATGESNVYNFAKGLSTGKTIVVVDNPAWNYDTSKKTNQRRDKYIIKAGERFRVREFKINDEFAISEDCATAATKSVLDENVFLTIDSSTGKFVAKTTTTTNAVFEAEIQRKRVAGGTIVTTANTYGYKRTMFEALVTTLA